MDQETFENQIGKTFEGKEVSAPDSIWEGIEQSLDSDLLLVHQSRARRYRAVAAAAILLAFLSFAFLLVERIPSPERSESESFNALRGDVPTTKPLYNPSFSSSTHSEFPIVFLSARKTASNDAEVFLISEDDSPPAIREYILPLTLTGKVPGILTAENKEVDIYRYRMVARNAVATKKTEYTDRKIWAGVEAGAGGFSGNLNSSDALSGAVNSSGLASASGLSDFVNPTNSVNQSSSTGTARSIGIDLGMELGKRWTLESGFSLNSMQNSSEAAINVLDVYTIDAKQFGIVPSGVSGSNGFGGSRTSVDQVEVVETFDTDVQVDSRVQFASVPVKAGYFLIRRKFSVRLNAGLAANYLLEGTIADPTNQIFASSSGLYNDWSFDGLSGLEFGVSLFEKLDFTLEPNYRYAIVPVTTVGAAPSRLMVQTGLRYRIQ